MRICTLAFLSLFVTKGHSQITIDNTTNTIAQLVSNVLIPVGSGTVVSNANFRGCVNISSRYQIGHFTTATTTATQIGFASGVILSTGNTSDVPLTLGVNPGSVAQMSRNYTSGTAGEIRSSNSAAGQDADAANLIAPENYYNAAILEFDFVPVNSFVLFRYVFGSEEYDDVSGSAFAINYNCSEYNDKFAFLLSGPGISAGQGYLNDAVNIARLSNNSSVGINSVNNGNVGSSGGAPSAANCTAANPLWTNGSPTAEFNGFIDGTELNGNTKALNAFYSGLTPGQTYHIRIVIADAKDGAYDSVVYLEAASFNTEINPLPIELAEFTGKCTENAVELNWTTASELNNDYFILTKSTDGLNFSPLTKINSYGFSSTPQSYMLEDRDKSRSTLYYKLTQVDLNGISKDLKTIAVNNNCIEQLDDAQINYQVSNSSIAIDLFEKKEGNVEVVVYNNLGELLVSTTVVLNKESEFQVPLKNPLNAGIYFVKLSMKDKRISKKLIVH